MLMTALIAGRYAHLIVPSTRVRINVGHLCRRTDKALMPEGDKGCAAAADETLTELPSLMMMRAFIMQRKDECEEDHEVNDDRNA